jgi:lactate dehydrogenase-like 2-hydroxyacid dehydrogenase
MAGTLTNTKGLLVVRWPNTRSWRVRFIKTWRTHSQQEGKAQVFSLSCGAIWVSSGAEILAAALAQVYSMSCGIAPAPQPDPFCDEVYPCDRNPEQTLPENDYIVCSAPLQTRGMIGAEQFDNAKKDAIFINVGRGPVVQEDALVAALQQGKLKGAALDVFATEPLPTSSPLWEMENVLLSPHNMDQTATFMHEATEFFVEENLPRFIRGEPLLNEVDALAGY